MLDLLSLKPYLFIRSAKSSLVNLARFNSALRNRASHGRARATVPDRLSIISLSWTVLQFFCSAQRGIAQACNREPEQGGRVERKVSTAPVPWEIAWAMEDWELLAAMVAIGEANGGKFDWDRVQWKEDS
jgi:hypothetical protein